MTLESYVGLRVHRNTRETTEHIFRTRSQNRVNVNPSDTLNNSLPVMLSPTRILGEHFLS